MLIKPCYKATGIGSTPFTDADEALAMVIKYLPDLPHWPQMPRTRREHFFYQSMTPFLDLGLLIIPETGHPFVQSEGVEDRFAAFYERYLTVKETGEGLDYFGIPQEAGEGLYRFCDKMMERDNRELIGAKGQIAGPLYIGLNLSDQDRRPIFYHPELKDILVKTLALNAVWQAKKLGQIASPVIFVDDPAIAGWGTATHVALSRSDMVSALKEIANEVHDAGGLVGAHSCAGIDWTVLIEAGIDIISFDAYYYFESLLGFAPQLQEFLVKGGMLAWGMVPTSHAIWEEDLDTLLLKFEEQQRRLVAAGVTQELLDTNTLITPSCGTGLLEIEEAERVYTLTAAMSAKLRSC
ncbi:MAG: hypothetical protein GX262_08490 [Clostridia bacterium]|nr:hypothetical protein [Clostridia bacterium]